MSALNVVLLLSGALGLLGTLGGAAAWVEARRDWPEGDMPVAAPSAPHTASEDATRALVASVSHVATLDAARAAERAATSDEAAPEGRTAAPRAALDASVAAWLSADGDAVPGDRIELSGIRAVAAHYRERAADAPAERPQAALADLATAVDVAAHIASAGPTLALLVAGADATTSAVTTAHGVLSALTSATLAKSDLRALADVLARTSARPSPVPAALAADCTSVEGQLPRAARSVHVSRLASYDRARTVSLLRSRCARLVRAHEVTRHLRPVAAFPSLTGTGFRRIAGTLDNGVGRVALDLYDLRTLERAAEHAERAAAQRVVLATRVALERARRRDGAFPATLESLVPDFLAELPVDPFTGRPPRWEAAQRELSSVGARGRVRL